MHERLNQPVWEPTVCIRTGQPLWPICAAYSHILNCGLQACSRIFIDHHRQGTPALCARPMPEMEFLATMKNTYANVIPIRNLTNHCHLHHQFEVRKVPGLTRQGVPTALQDHRRQLGQLLVQCWDRAEFRRNGKVCGKRQTDDRTPSDVD